jgi:hypothetical protein
MDSVSTIYLRSTKNKAVVLNVFAGSSHDPSCCLALSIKSSFQFLGMCYTAYIASNFSSFYPRIWLPFVNGVDRESKY